MARLPSEQFLMQQVSADVVLFEDGTERELARFDPDNGASVELALQEIWESTELSDEDRAFAVFWAGYFCAHADYPESLSWPVTYDRLSDLAGVFADGNNFDVVAEFDPRDANASALAQGTIHMSTLSSAEKRAAHFACGFFYGQAVSLR